MVRRGADGRLRYALTSGEPIFDESGTFRGYRGVGRDITAQMEAEARCASRASCSRASSTTARSR